MTKASANSGATTKSLRRRKKQRRAAQPVRDTDDVLYTIRDIIDEKKDKKGNLFYQIDWADDPRSGESYAPTWVCIQVNPTAETKQKPRLPVKTYIQPAG
jgi:hypothetical protein